MSPALNAPSSTPPANPAQATQNISKRFFDLVMSGRLEQLDDKQAEVIFGSRQAVGQLAFPARREPRLITRSPEAHDAMVSWKRRPAVECLDSEE